jgi:hypothetical protein
MIPSIARQVKMQNAAGAGKTGAGEASPAGLRGEVLLTGDTDPVY